MKERLLMTNFYVDNTCPFTTIIKKYKNSWWSHQYGRYWLHLYTADALIISVVLAFQFSRHVAMPCLKMADNACSYSVGKIKSSTLNRTDYTVGKRESHEFAMHDVSGYQITVQNFSTRVTTKYSRRRLIWAFRVKSTTCDALYL